mgnify:CR=1 FL=1
MAQILGVSVFDKTPVNELFTIGVPVRERIQAVEDEGAYLVVMGLKGRSNLEDILFGSTAEKMVRHCPVPLLSIRGNRSRSSAF